MYTCRPSFQFSKKLFRAAILQRTCQWNLSLVSKAFEKISFSSKISLSQVLCGFRKARSTHHPLFRLLQKWQKEFDSGRFIGAMLMDLTKTYDCLRHDLLIAKLEAYRLDNSTFNLLLGNKELKLFLLIVNSQKLDVEFFKDQFQGQFCSVYLLTTYS